MQARRGFTLLELLVGITLMALIAGSLYGTLYVAFKAQHSATESLDPARTAALALELLHRDFHGAMRPTGVLAGLFSGSAGPSTGESSSVSFFSCANEPDASDIASDIRKVDLSVETPADEDQPALIRRITTNLLAADAPSVREQVLCRNVKLFTVRYYDGTVWADVWDSSAQGNVLPLAVEVTIEFSLRPEREKGAERTYRFSRVYSIPCGVAVGQNG